MSALLKNIMQKLKLISGADSIGIDVQGIQDAEEKMNG